MPYIDRSKLPEHAVFGGSNPSWVNKSPEDIREQYLRSFATKSELSLTSSQPNVLSIGSV